MKKVIIMIVGCLMSISSFSQQNLYKWRLGIHGGLGTYYGDLSTGRILDPQTDVLKFWDKSENLSYGISLQGSMNRAWSFRIMSTIGSFQANDRATKWNGDPYTQSDNYQRALNFRTSYFDIDGLFIYSFDNGKFLGEESFFAPYIGVGAGFMNFKVKGDLYQSNSDQYHYWSDNTIRDIGESDPNAANAVIIEQDGNYETDLRSLQTEGKTYNNRTLTIPLAMGLKFRLNDRINLNMETLLHYAMTDYLDDVSGDYPVLFDNPQQAYASNPSNITRRSRGAGNNLKDVYGSFNLSIGYNFGYKKQAFNAPVFYMGKSDPSNVIMSETPMTETIDIEIDTKELEKEIEVEVIVKEESNNDIPVIIENATIQQLYVDTLIQGNNDVKIIRDTVYEQGILIKEKVIIRTDTIREIIKEETIIDDRSGSIINPIENNIVMEPLVLEWDTILMLDPVTLVEDTVVYSYAGETAVEEVPETPVFNIEAIEATPITEIDHEYFYENIGYLKEDLSEEEIILSEVQESNFELIALRNEINELKIKEDKSETEMDSLYQKLDELSLEYAKFEGYNNSISIAGNTDANQPTNLEIQKTTTEMEENLREVRTEIIYMNAPVTDNSEYERIRKENDKRIKALEKEMRKLRKDVRKSKRKNLPPRVNNPSRLKEKEEKEKKEEMIVPSSQTIVVEQSDPSVGLEYQLQIKKLEQELSKVKSSQAQSNSNKDSEIQVLNGKLADLERKITATQVTGNTDSKTIEYISNLERKLDNLNSQLSNTQRELEILRNRPAPKPSTTIITQPATPVQSQIISTVPSSYDAVNRLGIVSIYFNTGKSYIKTEFFNDLSQVISLMKQYPEIKVNLTGYTDSSGNPDSNLRLSKKRAEAVADYLRKRGISSSRISTNHLGEINSNTDDDPYSRRVEIKLNTY